MYSPSLPWLKQYFAILSLPLPIWPQYTHILEHFKVNLRYLVILPIASSVFISKIFLKNNYHAIITPDNIKKNNFFIVSKIPVHFQIASVIQNNLVFSVIGLN